MTKHKVIITTIVSLSLLFTGGAMAKHHGEHGHQGLGFERAIAQLQLTEQQQQAMKTIRMDSKQQIRVLKKQMQPNESRQKMMALIQAKTFDEQAFSKLQQSRLTMKSNIALIKAKAKHKVYHLLTPAQQQKLEDMREKRQQRKLQKKHQRDNRANAERHGNSQQ